MKSLGLWESACTLRMFSLLGLLFSDSGRTASAHFQAMLLE